MKHFAFPFIALLSIASEVGATAQANRPGPSRREYEEVRVIQTRFGDCVVKKRHVAARNFVLMPEFEKESDWDRVVDKVRDGDCLVAAAASPGGVRMTFPADLLRYTLADALVRREFSVGPPPFIKDAAPLVQPSLDEADYVPKPGRKLKQAELDRLAQKRVRQADLILLARYGECIARADASRSHALIMSVPESPQEKAVFASLNAALSDCLASGQKLALGKVALRGTIAMNLYRLAHAPKMAATAQVAK